MLDLPQPVPAERRYQSQWLDPARPHSLLELDPDLGRRLAPDRARGAARELCVRAAMLGRGAWRPERFRHGAATVGLLVVDGAIVREISVHDAPSAELFGPGDIIRVGPAAADPALVAVSVRWRALTRATVATIDGRCARALQRYPEVAAIVLDRLNARAERLAVTQAISQVTGVDTRVELLLWHLAERWGRVGTEGVILPLVLSHRIIGSLVGSRRPTVSTALARLAEEQRITRRADGTWLLTSSTSRLRPHDPLDGVAASSGLELDDVHPIAL